jgi:hypothetical protein
VDTAIAFWIDRCDVKGVVSRAIAGSGESGGDAVGIVALTSPARLAVVEMSERIDGTVAMAGSASCALCSAAAPYDGQFTADISSAATTH